MNIFSKTHNPIKVAHSLLSVIFILVFFSVSCAEFKPHPNSAAKKPEPKTVKAVVTPVPTTTTTHNTENSPAASIVAEALGAVAAKAFESAEWKIEEAIKLDPFYGPAYYWLARIKLELKDLQQALMFLKRAENLLGTSENWREKLEELRKQIEL